LGTVFKSDTQGIGADLLLLDYGNGAYPYAGVTRNRDGYFYGTLCNGGMANLGTVF